MNWKYLGREDADAALSHALQSGSVLLEGPRGVGKTELLKQWENKKNPDRITLRFDLQGVESPQELANRMSKSAHLRRTRGEALVATLLGQWDRPDPWDNLEQVVNRARRPLLVLFDEVQLYLDHVSKKDPIRARDDLQRLDELRNHPAAEFVFTGSIGMDPVARQLDVTLSVDWYRLTLPPLDEASGQALFQHICSGACSDDLLHLGTHLAGGLPRWIRLLAQRTRGGTAELVATDLERAVQSLLATAPFNNELGHLARYANPRLARQALELCAVEGATKNSVLAGIHAPRRQAESLLDDLARDFYLRTDTVEHTLPLFARWLRR